jgi:hypothetical protein
MKTSVAVLGLLLSPSLLFAEALAHANFYVPNGRSRSLMASGSQ